MPHLKRTVFFAAALLVLVALSFHAVSMGRAHDDFSELQLLPKAQPVIGFSLSDISSQAFTEKNLTGKWTLVFFGFTHCADICPLELKILSEVLELQENAKESSAQVLFISLDPERDAHATIATYTKNFNAKINGVTGSNKELAKLTRFFGADYSRVAQSDGAPLNVPAGVNMPENITGDYQVNHPARIYLLNPQGHYVGSFTPPHNAKNIWNDMRLIIKR